MPKNSILAVISVIAIGMAAIGLFVSGGPSVGKAERRDQARIEDLYELRELTFCLAETAGGVLPKIIDNSDTCARDIMFNDPYDDVPYVYEWISERSYKYCASFEYPERITIYDSASFDPTTGCIQFTYRP
ncbi:MAG: hypothetical protein P8L68_01270 [Paracoccaceae bacterium]|nr:hypothetical protein [Paracoccaceae bacterium]MDG2257110.1 hypothetical protein [Paracoccaceae bacterium]